MAPGQTSTDRNRPKIPGSRAALVERRWTATGRPRVCVKCSRALNSRPPRRGVAARTIAATRCKRRNQKTIRKAQPQNQTVKRAGIRSTRFSSAGCSAECGTIEGEVGEKGSPTEFSATKKAWGFSRGWDHDKRLPSEISHEKGSKNFNEAASQIQ